MATSMKLEPLADTRLAYGIIQVLIDVFDALLRSLKPAWAISQRLLNCGARHRIHWMHFNLAPARVRIAGDVRLTRSIQVLGWC